MTNDAGKSDSSVLPGKPPNNAGQSATEVVEGRGLAKGNPSESNTHRTQSRDNVPTALERIRQAARKDRKQRFTSLLHHVYDVDRLRLAYLATKRDAAAGIDGETWRHYGENLEANLQDLSARLARGAYRAQPVRRAYIPKADGRLRPLGVPTLEDKIVQRAVAEVCSAICEADFLGFSYGFRPGRSPHQALDATTVGITKKKVNWVLDADIRDFFGTLVHEWLVKFVEHRIGDKRVVRLIQKWLNAGVMEDGKRVRSEVGTIQGGSISPLLANIYLHYALDLWAQRWRKTQARGDVVIVRFCDDFVVGFEHREEAERFLTDLRERFAKFGLGLHPDKTRLIEFGRFADKSRRERGDGKPESFNFLGFTHICGKTSLSPRNCPNLAVGASAPKPEGTNAVDTLRETRGALATTAHHLSSLSRPATCRHHPRQEPDAVMPPVRICGGGRGRPRFLLRLVGILARIRGDTQLESGRLREQRGDECCQRRSNFSSR